MQPHLPVSGLLSSGTPTNKSELPSTTMFVIFAMTAWEVGQGQTETLSAISQHHTRKALIPSEKPHPLSGRSFQSLICLTSWIGPCLPYARSGYKAEAHLDRARGLRVPLKDVWAQENDPERGQKAPKTNAGGNRKETPEPALSQAPLLLTQPRRWAFTWGGQHRSLTSLTRPCHL